MDIPPHLLHERQCVEACRTSNSEMEGFAVFDQQERRCTHLCGRRHHHHHHQYHHQVHLCGKEVEVELIGSYRFSTRLLCIPLQGSLCVPCVLILIRRLVPLRFTISNWFQKLRTVMSYFSRDRSSGGNHCTTWLMEKCIATGQNPTSKILRGTGDS